MELSLDLREGGCLLQVGRSCETATQRQSEAGGCGPALLWGCSITGPAQLGTSNIDDEEGKALW